MTMQRMAMQRIISSVGQPIRELSVSARAVGQPIRELRVSTAAFSNLHDLGESAFWRKKLLRAAQVRDTNKDGSITRADFELACQRYKELGLSDEHYKNLCDSVMKGCDSWGLSDNTKTLSYEEFVEQYYQTLKKLGQHEPISSRFVEMFKIIDSNGDGEISLQEWIDHYKCFGIDVKHAKASFEAMDSNGDQKVSADEFANYHNEYFFSTEDKLKSSILFGPLD